MIDLASLPWWVLTFLYFIGLTVVIYVLGWINADSAETDWIPFFSLFYPVWIPVGAAALCLAAVLAGPYWVCKQALERGVKHGGGK
jgi:hypothetical protein